MPEVPLSYFRKAVLSTQIFQSNGKPIPWTNIGWNTGALETNDAKLIKELNKFAEEVKGGVQVITKEQFDELKKNSATSSRPKVWQPTVSGDLGLPIQAQSPNPQSASSPVSAAAAKPDAPVTAAGVLPAAKPVA